MGLAVSREEFREEEYDGFAAKLRECLEALGVLLGRPGFGAGPQTLGSELELFLVDAEGRPYPFNHRILADVADPRITYELARFNLECNLEPVPFAGRPFSSFAEQMAAVLGEIRQAAAAHGARMAVVGILPTLTAADFGAGAITDIPRYRALAARLRYRRGEPFRIRIDGEEPLEIENEAVSFEGATTSFQLHLRAEPERFTDLYNAAQLATAPVLAVSGNSPTFLGHRLWEETRVALFRQATDPRPSAPPGARPAGLPRVCFGWRWLDDGPLELFRETVEIFEPVLPLLAMEDPLRVARDGDLPALSELRIHHGTVWRWNRPVYDAADGGHLRIEFRALPAGPTTLDMIANGAFLLGLTVALAPRAAEFTRALAFPEVQRNFYRSAQHGLNAKLAWPFLGGVERRTARELVPELLPLAQEGLDASGVEPEESRSLLGIVEARAATGQTGAAWQRRTAAALENGLGRGEALSAMLERYLELSAAGEPVHLWRVG